MSDPRSPYVFNGPITARDAYITSLQDPTAPKGSPAYVQIGGVINLTQDEFSYLSQRVHLDAVVGTPPPAVPAAVVFVSPTQPTNPPLPSVWIPTDPETGVPGDMSTWQVYS